MSVLTDLENEFSKVVKDVENTSSEVLRNMHADALAFEARVKTELVLIRQRAANLPSDTEIEAEALIMRARALQAQAAAWIKTLEHKLFGTNVVKDYNTGETFK